MRRRELLLNVSVLCPLAAAGATGPSPGIVQGLNLGTSATRRVLKRTLVHRLISGRHTAVGKIAIGPPGWREKGSSASLLVRYVSHRIRFSLALGVLSPK
jgi:hypothetical protein